MTDERKEMTLKVKKRLLNIVDHEDVQTLICQVYGIDEINIPYMEAWNNDSVHRIKVAKCDLSNLDQIDLNKMIAGKVHACDLKIILTDLCNRDLLEEGEYLIDVSW